MLGLLVFSQLGCNRTPPQSLTQREIVDSIASIEPWNVDGTYSEQAWKRLLQTAKALQKCDTNTVARALAKESSTTNAVRNVIAKYVPKKEKPNYRGSYEEDSKPFLLLRIMFELPEHAPADQRFASKGWHRSLDLEGRLSGHNVDGTVNLAWPIAWQNCQPTLTAGCIGSSGPPYDARAEYMFMLSRFPPRNLDCGR